jgi:hypothetical protein
MPNSVLSESMLNEVGERYDEIVLDRPEPINRIKLAFGTMLQTAELNYCVPSRQMDVMECANTNGKSPCM